MLHGTCNYRVGFKRCLSLFTDIWRTARSYQLRWIDYLYHIHCYVFMDVFNLGTVQMSGRECGLSQQQVCTNIYIFLSSTWSRHLGSPFNVLVVHLNICQQ